jgi:hypothetical protein
MHLDLEMAGRHRGVGAGQRARFLSRRDLVDRPAAGAGDEAGACARAAAAIDNAITASIIFFVMDLLLRGR